MTVRRRDGGREETPFGAWLRGRKDIDSIIHSVTANDVDWMLHKYRANVDGLGTRQVQLMMTVETKCFGAMPSDDQRQTLFFQHQCLNHKGPLTDAKSGGRSMVWNFGAFVLSMDGECPQRDDELVRWCRFLPDGQLRERAIPVATLARILSFDLRPDTGRKIDLRRHHSWKELTIHEKQPLGFETPVIVVRAS